MNAECANQNNKENLEKFAEYINSKRNPPEFASTLLFLCKPRRNHLPDRDQKAKVSV